MAQGATIAVPGRHAVDLDRACHSAETQAEGELAAFGEGTFLPVENDVEL